ncbi:PE domain-containing protein [Mycobacterium tuberculosis]|uniref:PE domain-containing protein n=1 Tax=Mycobacterium tuberculosis TaxID=1773 RepID=UPI003D7C9269
MSISAANASAASATRIGAAGADEMSAVLRRCSAGLAWSTRRLVRRWRPTTSGLCGALSTGAGA